jgi:hypothetical protein
MGMRTTSRQTSGQSETAQASGVLFLGKNLYKHKYSIQLFGKNSTKGSSIKGKTLGSHKISILSPKNSPRISEKGSLLKLFSKTNMRFKDAKRIVTMG